MEKSVGAYPLTHPHNNSYGRTRQNPTTFARPLTDPFHMSIICPQRESSVQLFYTTPKNLRLVLRKAGPFLCNLITHSSVFYYRTSGVIIRLFERHGA